MFEDVQAVAAFDFGEVERGRRGVRRRVLLLLAPLASPAAGVADVSGVVGGVADVSVVAGVRRPLRVRRPPPDEVPAEAEGDAVPPISCNDERTLAASFMRHLLARSASLSRCA